MTRSDGSHSIRNRPTPTPTLGEWVCAYLPVCLNYGRLTEIMCEAASPLQAVKVLASRPSGNRETVLPKFQFAILERRSSILQEERTGSSLSPIEAGWKMSVYRLSTFPSRVLYNPAISWSDDGKISVCTDEGVVIMVSGSVTELAEWTWRGATRSHDQFCMYFIIFIKCQHSRNP